MGGPVRKLSSLYSAGIFDVGKFLGDRNVVTCNVNASRGAGNLGVFLVRDNMNEEMCIMKALPISNKVKWCLYMKSISSLESLTQTMYSSSTTIC